MFEREIYYLSDNDGAVVESLRIKTDKPEPPKPPPIDVYEKLIQTNDKTVLNLIGCDLEYFPDDLLQLRTVDGLFLSNNNLTEIPCEISKLQNLEILVLQGNKLHHLTHAIGLTLKLCH